MKKSSLIWSLIHLFSLILKQVIQWRLKFREIRELSQFIPKKFIFQLFLLCFINRVELRPFQHWAWSWCNSLTGKFFYRRIFFISVGSRRVGNRNKEFDFIILKIKLFLLLVLGLLCLNECRRRIWNISAALLMIWR